MSTIQFNLLPDVKLEYLKAQRQRQLFTSIATIVTIVSLAILLLMFAAHAVQKKRINDLSASITSESRQLANTPDINKVLTVQNQLTQLTNLHNSKPEASQLFLYLNQLTPAKADISNLSIDFTQSTATITGLSDSLTTINSYVDELKAATYTSSNVPTATPAFSNVVLSSFGYSDSSKSNTQPATYTLTFSYDKQIFDITAKDITVQVPSITTNRSEVSQPTDLFTSDGTKTTGSKQ